jgi:hypothetical protein
MTAKNNFFSDWLMLKKIFSSETAWPNGAKLGLDGHRTLEPLLIIDNYC